MTKQKAKLAQADGCHTLYSSDALSQEFGTIRLAKWPEGLVLWVNGEIRWRSWEDPGLGGQRISGGPPDPPIALVVSRLGGRASLSWQRGRGGAEPSYYTVETWNEYYQRWDQTSTTSTSIEINCPPGKTWMARVSALSDDGQASAARETSCSSLRDNLVSLTF